MIKYIVKRLLLLIPVLIGITFLSFAMMRVAGGDAVTYMYENAGAAVSQDVIDETRKNMVWISRFLSSMRNGSQEWQPEIWESVMYQKEMFMILSWKNFLPRFF